MKVQRTVVLAAPPDDVWPALADADRLASWFGGRVELDARPGGRVVLADEDGERWGTVEAFDPGRVLTLRLWEQPGALAGTRLELILEATGEGTLLTVVESTIEAGGGWSGHRQTVVASRG